ncbi:MAG: S8 family serine peptidase, partial [Acidimicrobiia bacterium]|nr:S8 family serine peptidase [Acidimicrobiia bacterium]
MKRFAVLFVALLTMLALTVPAAAAPGGDQGPKEGTPAAEKITTKSDAALKKIHPKLREQIETGATQVIPVYATVVGDGNAVAATLQNAHVAQADGAALVVGSTGIQSLTKVAGKEGVVSVGPIDFEKSGSPLGSPEPELERAPDLATLQSFLNNLHKQEVPYADAPPLAESNFDELQEMGVLDAKTHNFAGAWEQGYTGEGSLVAVLDSGTDFGHPDLIGTWATGPDGWPYAFDPYGTLLWLEAPSLIEQGLSFYSLTDQKTEFAQNAQDRKNDLYRVVFETRLGPSRNFSAPNAKVAHEYTFPMDWALDGAVRLGSHPDDYLLQLFSERPAFIVVDPDGDGTYDTIYVDLDNDYEFADEKPVTKASPVSYRDMNGDGYTDLSGGLVYHISDGSTPLRGGPEYFGLSIVADPGELVAWTGDFDPALAGHGTSTASNVVAQGVINGLAPEFDDIGTYPGAVIGGAPDAKLAPFSDIYFSLDFSTQLAYLLTGDSGIDASSNSYGKSDVDNDGYDAASQEADIWYYLTGGLTTPVFSTGNGAPGFGTTAPPSPSVGVSVGASTQFGGTGWDSIANESQVVDNDVMVWSNRGPGATGSNGVDIVADGAFSAGDVTLNTVLDGRIAWDTWGGTSRSAPVVAGATALVYQAYRNTHGPIPFDFNKTAKEILAGSAMDLGYESWLQGGGSLDAGRAVMAAAGAAASVSPSEWRPGDYEGVEWDVFTHIISPGESDTQTFDVNGSGTYAVSDRQLVRTDSKTMDFTSSRVNKESAYNFNTPDYLIDISDIVTAHPDADLMVVRANTDYSQHDANGDYVTDQQWRLMTYNWTDVNDNGTLWVDQDNDGTVDHTQLPFSTNIDGFQDINYNGSEIDEGEYVRFMYHRAFANTLQNYVRDPADRMADGLFIGFQHNQRSNAHRTTAFEIRIDFYENVDWDWITTNGTVSGGGTFGATIDVPADTPYGMYGGAVVLANTSDPSDVIVVPVSVAVAATASQDTDGRIIGSVEFGGAEVAAAQEDLLYNNGSVFGATDWSWRAESGDWRFFFMDVLAEPADGSLLLVNTTWDDAAPYTDLDTLVFGPSSNAYQLFGGGPFGAPYVLDTVANSPNTNIGAGVWLFDTATGGAEDLVAAPVQGGLHAIVQHQVNFQGDQFDVPFELTVAG